MNWLESLFSEAEIGRQVNRYDCQRAQAEQRRSNGPCLIGACLNAIRAGDSRYAPLQARPLAAIYRRHSWDTVRCAQTGDEGTSRSLARAVKPRQALADLACCGSVRSVPWL